MAQSVLATQAMREETVDPIQAWPSPAMTNVHGSGQPSIIVYLHPMSHHAAPPQNLISASGSPICHPPSSESVATPDFAGDESDPSEIPEFDRAMRGLIKVSKSELDSALQSEKKARKIKGTPRSRQE